MASGEWDTLLEDSTLVRCALHLSMGSVRGTMRLSYEEMRVLSKFLEGEEIEKDSRESKVLNRIRLRLNVWMAKRAESQKQEVINNPYT